MRAHGLWPTSLLYPWDSPGENTGVGCHFLLQRIFPTKGSNPGPLHCRQILYHWTTRVFPTFFNLSLNVESAQMWDLWGLLCRHHIWAESKNVRMISLPPPLCNSHTIYVCHTWAHRGTHTHTHAHTHTHRHRNTRFASNARSSHLSHLQEASQEASDPPTAVKIWLTYLASLSLSFL